MTEHNEITTNQISIDEPTAKEMMGYYKINHNEFVKYIKGLGIEHND
jgi:hypothetical protein